MHPAMLQLRSAEALRGLVPVAAFRMPRALSVSACATPRTVSTAAPLGRFCCSQSMRGTYKAGRELKAAGHARSLNLPNDRDLEEPLDGFDRISEALLELAAGKFLVVLDDESRENEGDLIIAADKVTTESMAFMVEYTSGVICIAMEGKDLDRLRLPLMVRSEENEDTMYTAFTVTVDLRDGITTGISAQDRANTLRKLADPNAQPGEFRRPGHIFPLRYRPGGVLVRPGHTEASVDLARLAGSFPAGALSEIVNKHDGSMARTPELLQFAREHGLRCIAIADLMRYRLRYEQLVTLTHTTSLNTRHGNVKVHTFKSALDDAEHVAVVVGDVATKEDVLLHVQRLGSVADLLGCAPVMTHGKPAEDMLQHMAMHGQGVSIFMQSPASDRMSLAEELQCLSSEQQQAAEGKSAMTAASCALDLLDYGLADQIITALQIKSVSLASDDRAQHMALKSCGTPINSIAAGATGAGMVDGHAVNGQAKSYIMGVPALI